MATLSCNALHMPHSAAAAAHQGHQPPLGLVSTPLQVQGC